MSKKLKSYLDDENFLKAKKVWSEFERKQNKYFNSPQNYKDKIWNNYIKNKGFVSQKFSTNERSYTTKLLTQKRGYNPQVVIKITGSDKNFNQIKSHIKYISRNGTLEVFVKDPYDNDGEICMKNLDEISKSFNDEIYNIPTKSEIKEHNLKDKNENIHMVFSMKGENQIPPIEIKRAALQTIKEKFPNNHFILAIHNDTDNPHCHLDLKAVDENGKRIKISPSDLNAMRDSFAKNLTKLGYKAMNFSHKRNAFLKDKFVDIWNKHKAHHYKITGYGKAKYNFSLDDNAKESYYVKFETSKGKETILWGKHLQELMDKYNITNGDYVRFAITDQEPISKKIYDKKTKKWYEKTVYKNVWDCSVEGKREIELKPLRKSEKRKTKFNVLTNDNTEILLSTLQAQNVNMGQSNTGVNETQILQTKQTKKAKTIMESKKDAIIKKQELDR